MVTSKSLPVSRNISKQDLYYVFAACVFPVHVWAIYNLLKEIPAWLLRFNTWDLFGAVAYTQMFALIESLVILIPLVMLGLILPGRLFRNKFVALSAMLVFLISTWMIMAHINNNAINNWGARQFLPWIGLFLVSLVIGYVLVNRFSGLEKSILSLVQRIAVLSSLYLVFDLLSIFVVVVRNI